MVFLVLTTSGREVARRQGATCVNEAGAESLRQMRELQLLPGAVLTLDVTDNPASAAARVRRVLNTQVFKVRVV